MFPNGASLFQSVERWFTVSRRHVCPGTLNISPCQECLQGTSGLSVPTDPCYPLKAKPGKMRAPSPQIMENEGRTCFQRSSQVPPLLLFFFFTAYVKLVVVVEVLINSVPLKLAKVYTKHLLWQKATSECFGWDVKLFMGDTLVQPGCKQYFICDFAASS